MLQSIGPEKSHLLEGFFFGNFEAHLTIFDHIFTSRNKPSILLPQVTAISTYGVMIELWIMPDNPSEADALRIYPQERERDFQLLRCSEGWTSRIGEGLEHGGYQKMDGFCEGKLSKKMDDDWRYEAPILVFSWFVANEP